MINSSIWLSIDNKEEKKYINHTEQDMERNFDEVDRDVENEELKDAPKNDMYVFDWFFYWSYHSFPITNDYNLLMTNSFKLALYSESEQKW